MNKRPSGPLFRRFLSFVSQHREWLITALGVLGLIIFVGFYDRAFPSAAIDLSLSRAEITALAETTMAGLGYDLDDYKYALTFGRGSWASYYLQQTLGIPETNRLIRENDLPVWYWQARWFRPLEKEAFYLYLDPQGEVVGFSHVILEDANGASLSQEKARSLARNYLSEGRGWDLADWESVSASSEEKPGGRVDHEFSWKRSDWAVADSQLRLSVTVQGGEVSYYDYWLKVPESFMRGFAEKQNVAGFMTSASVMGTLILVGLILGLAFWKSHWQIALSVKRALWPALVVAFVVAASGINSLPLVKAWYNTTEDYRIFWIYRILSVASEATFYGALVLLLWMIGQWLSQRVWPHQDRILARRGNRWQHLARSGWRGLMLGWMSGGYVVVFYLVATQIFGGWSPVGPEYTSAYATPLPFLGALEGGLVPSVTEELVWRLILIAGVLWLTRTVTGLPKGVCVVLALLVPGALWGFAHSNYVRDPITFRGIELTLKAVLVEGLFFLHFDLMTTMMAHFVYNAGLGAIPLLRSGEPYFVASGVVVLLMMLVPTIPYLAMEIRRRLHGEVREDRDPQITFAEPHDREALEVLPISDIDWETLLDDPDAAVFCLRLEDTVIGTAAGRVSAGAEGSILTVYVDPDWRRRYWGSDLLVALRTQLHEKGAETIQCRIDVKNKAARRFLVSRLWNEAQIVFQWPSESRSLPGWRVLISKILPGKGVSKS